MEIVNYSKAETTYQNNRYYGALYKAIVVHINYY